MRAVINRDMRLLTSFSAGLWLFVVGLQGLAFLVHYGMLPGLPPEIGRVDFTPQYALPALLVVAGSVAARTRLSVVRVSEDEAREIPAHRERERRKRP